MRSESISGAGDNARAASVIRNQWAISEITSYFMAGIDGAPVPKYRLKYLRPHVTRCFTSRAARGPWTVKPFDVVRARTFNDLRHQRGNDVLYRWSNLFLERSSAISKASLANSAVVRNRT
ncbi:hypothetical protein EVAR_64294_1, partial [Eumeta japonica]